MAETYQEQGLPPVTSGGHPVVTREHLNQMAINIRVLRANSSDPLVYDEGALLSVGPSGQFVPVISFRGEIVVGTGVGWVFRGGDPGDWVSSGSGETTGPDLQFVDFPPNWVARLMLI